MPPLPELTRFSIEMFEEVLEVCKCEIYLLDTFEDGMTRWGTAQAVNPFAGSSAVADTTADHTITLTEVKAILHKLDYAGHYPRIEEEVLRRIRERGNGENH